MQLNGRQTSVQSSEKHADVSAARSTTNSSEPPPSAAWSADVWVWSSALTRSTCCRRKKEPSSPAWTPAASRPPLRRASTPNSTTSDSKPRPADSRRPQTKTSSIASARSPNWPSATGAKISAGTSQKTRAEPATSSAVTAVTSRWERTEKKMKRRRQRRRWKRRQTRASPVCRTIQKNPNSRTVLLRIRPKSKRETKDSSRKNISLRKTEDSRRQMVKETVHLRTHMTFLLL